jgi:hypothetical protein
MMADDNMHKLTMLNMLPTSMIYNTNGEAGALCNIPIVTVVIMITFRCDLVLGVSAHPVEGRLGHLPRARRWPELRERDVSSVKRYSLSRRTGQRRARVGSRPCCKGHRRHLRKTEPTRVRRLCWWEREATRRSTVLVETEVSSVH